MKPQWAAVVMLTITLAVQAADTRTDPEHKYAWGENIGWVNAGPSNHAIRIHFDGNQGWLSGYAWGENIGWIKMGGSAGGPFVNTTADNWGVNMAANGVLSGYAWGDNVANTDKSIGDMDTEGSLGSGTEPWSMGDLAGGPMFV